MTNVIRVALPGVDALENTDPQNFSLFSDIDNVLIKEFERGSGSVDKNDTVTITHNLGYVPFYLAYGEVGTNRFRVINAYQPFGGGWRIYATTTTLVITNFYSAIYTSYKYYIFYDDVV